MNDDAGIGILVGSAADVVAASFAGEAVSAGLAIQVVLFAAAVTSIDASPACVDRLSPSRRSRVVHRQSWVFAVVDVQRHLERNRP